MLRKKIISSLKQIRNREMIRHSVRTFKQTVLNYRTVYYNDFVRRVLLAQVLNLRCDGCSKRKKRIIKGFASLERSGYRLAFAVVKNRILRKNHITIGVDLELLKSVLSTKLINLYGRFKGVFY